MNNPKVLLLIVLAFALLAGNVFLGIQYTASQKELKETQGALKVQNINGKTLAFTQLFIEKVLKSESEVDFDTRLQLENAVRGIGDEEILAQWQKFTESKTEAEAQQQVKNLLELLVRKVEM